jgi:26S proteasome regulatory subunit T3
VDIQEEYIKDEQKNLMRELLRAQEEVKRIQSVPLVIGQFIEMVDRNNGIVGSCTGSNYYVRILSTINRELLKLSSSVALHRHSNTLVDILLPKADSSISLLSQSEKPDVTYSYVSPSLKAILLCNWNPVNCLESKGFVLRLLRALNC